MSVVADLTPERRAEIARVTDAATPGPWTVTPSKIVVACTQLGPKIDAWDSYSYDIRAANRKNMLYHHVDVREPVDGPPPPPPDATFIALARTAIPELLAALTAQEEENARLRETLERERIATTAAANRGWRSGP